MAGLEVEVLRENTLEEVEKLGGIRPGVGRGRNITKSEEAPLPPP